VGAAAVRLEISKPDSWISQTAVILAHGAGQGMDSPFMAYFHTELAKRGLLSIKFNFEYMEAKRRMPDSQPKLQARYRAVIKQVVDQYRPRHLIIGGKSMGGRVASYVAADAPEVNALMFLGYPLHPPGKPDQLRDQHLYGLKIPMLFVSGTKDTFADRELLKRVAAKIGNNATLFWIEGGDHSLKRGREDAKSRAVAIETIVDWAARELP
jgi:uncharacterized protein